MKNSILIIFFLMSIINLSFAQKKDEIYIAEDLVYSEDFNQAIILYNQIVKFDPYNPLYQFNLGFCYLNTRMSKDSSIMYLKNSIAYYSKRKYKNTVNIDEVTFYLGRAYRVNNYFDSAIIVLNKLKSSTTNRKFKKIIENELNLAISAAELYKAPVNFDIKNLGNTLNTEYSEHSPILSLDENILIFTSRRNNGKPIMFDNQYDEDIFISEKIDDSWTTPISISDSINTSEHEASIGLSYDGQQLFIYKEEEEGSIYYSQQIDDIWTTPIKLGENINTRFRETHASLSLDGNYLYFTSSRSGGFGGQDIYVSEKQKDGNWGVAKNLGNKINSAKDEEGPYIHPDGKTLYFSSGGHKGMGGYDIFISEKSDSGFWQEAKNIGFPINTVEDDVFYFPTADGTRAYYASYKPDAYGKTDIYMISIPEAKTTDLTVMTGILTVCEGTRPRAYITITDKQTGEYFLATPNKKGKFIFVTHRGRTYDVLIETELSTVFHEEFTVDKNAPFLALYKAIRLDPEINCTNKTDSLTVDMLEDTLLIDSTGNVYDEFLELENILFDFGKANELLQNETLDKLAHYLSENQDAIIEIGAYADSKGSAIYNYNLSLKRGEIVKKYLIDRGVQASQLVVVGYGEENPVTKNKNIDGTWNPEGQKFNRRAEFKVIQQGETTLLIWPFKVPENLKNEFYIPNYHKKNKDFIETEI